MENEISIEESGIIRSENLISKAALASVFAVCFISIFFSGIFSMLMSVYLPVAVRDLLGNVSETKFNEVSALINSLFIFGWMFGGFAWGFICDRIGRSRSVILSTAFYAAFAMSTALSSSWLWVSLSRFLTGFGIGGVLVTTTILVAELWTGKNRAIALGIVSVAMPIGFFAAGLINNLMPGWRQAFFLGSAPLILAAVSAFLLKESDEWQSGKQRVSKGISQGRALFAAGHNRAILSGSLIFGAMLIGLWAIFAWTPTWIQSIAGAADANYLRGLTMMILASGGLVGSFASGWIANAIGLRKTMILCFAACFALTFLLFKLNHSISWLIWCEMVVLAFFFGISQGALAVYIPILFPTMIRASATGFCFNVGRIFTGTVVFFIGALVSFLGGYGNGIFIFSFIFIVGLICTYFSSEVRPSVQEETKP